MADAERADALLVETMRAGMSSAELAALDHVVDFDGEQAQCPACGTAFSTADSRCPDCGLNFG